MLTWIDERAFARPISLIAADICMRIMREKGRGTHKSQTGMLENNAASDELRSTLARKGEKDRERERERVGDLLRKKDSLRGPRRKEFRPSCSYFRLGRATRQCS